MRTVPWIDRLQQEPPQTDARIVVWREASDVTDGAVVTALWLPCVWVDASNAEREVSFRYWQPAPASPYEQDTPPRQVEYYRWWVADGSSGVRRLSRHLMRREAALMLHPDAEPDRASRVVRDPSAAGRAPGER